MAKYEVVSIGDSTVDTFLELSAADVHCTLHPGRCELCLNYAEKIPVENVTRTFGGNPANFAIGAVRLRLKSAILTGLGQDGFGQEILGNFKSHKVGTEFIRFDKTPTRVNHILLFRGERTVLSHQVPRAYDLPSSLAQSKPGWIYYSSLPAGHEKLHAKIPALVRKQNLKLSFNPGTYQISVEGLGGLKPILAVTHVLLLNRQEAEKLLGKRAKVEKLLFDLAKFGPKTAVITDGLNGADAFDGKDFYYQKIYPLKARERTGAGDAFSCGFVCALILGKDIKEALRWGTVNAAFVTQKVGAQEGLLRRPELEKILKKWR